MSGSDTPSQASLLGPGIADIFIQGIEAGLVLSQFSQWFSASDRIESSFSSTIVVFVTLVGLYVSMHSTCDFNSPSICIYEVRNPEQALHWVGLSTYRTLACSYVSLRSHLPRR